MGLREDREPGAVLQRKKLNIFINLLSPSSPAAAGGLNHVTLDWPRGRSRLRASTGGEATSAAGKKKKTSQKKKPPALPHYTFPRRAVCSITIPRADAGGMSSFPLHSQAECTKIQRREKHNKFRLRVRAPAGNKVEDEQWRLDGRRVCACMCWKGGYILEKKKRGERRSTTSSLQVHESI